MKTINFRFDDEDQELLSRIQQAISETVHYRVTIADVIYEGLKLLETHYASALKIVDGLPPDEEDDEDEKPKRKRRKRNADGDLEDRDDDDVEDIPEEREEDVKPLYGGGFPPDVEEELAESRRASLRKRKK